MKAQILILAALVSYEAGAAQYLCVSDKTTGFKYSSTDQTWISANFISDNKYTLSDSSGRYLLRAPGADEPVAKCGEFNKANVLFCSGWVEFVFHKETGRYTESSTGAYHLVGTELFPTDKKDIPNPSISIGECTEF